MITHGDRDGWGLLTDLYELTMAFGFWKQGLAEREAVFHLTFREHPFGGSYTIAAGLGYLCEMLNEFRFTASDIDYLAELCGIDDTPLFEREFLEYLAAMRFTGHIDAMEEGTIVFPHEPLVRVQGPLVQAQIIESLVLNVINFQTLVATKAARICQAAAPGAVIDFGLRRAQGESGALAATRAAFIGGCSGTSNVLAGKRYGIPVRGTHAHSWVMTFDSELEAFTKYAETMPNNCVFLVDTYDTVQGLQRAIEVALSMKAVGHRLVGVRLDSGDLVALSRTARSMLDSAGLQDAAVVASNDLDEYEISKLKERGATIDIWGVGTRLITAYDQPALGGVYKLSALRDEAGNWQPKIKASEQPIKVSTPGILQVRRFATDQQIWGDVIYDESTGIDPPLTSVGQKQTHIVPETAEGKDLLVPVYRGGDLVYKTPSLTQSRQRTLEQLQAFETTTKRAIATHNYSVGLEGRLDATKRRLLAEAREA